MNQDLNINRPAVSRCASGHLTTQFLSLPVVCVDGEKDREREIEGERERESMRERESTRERERKSMRERERERERGKERERERFLP